MYEKIWTRINTVSPKDAQEIKDQVFLLLNYTIWR